MSVDTPNSLAEVAVEVGGVDHDVFLGEVDAGLKEAPELFIGDLDVCAAVELLDLDSVEWALAEDVGVEQLVRVIEIDSQLFKAGCLLVGEHDGVLVITILGGGFGCLGFGDCRSVVGYWRTSIWG